MYHAEHSCCPPHSGAEDVSFFYVTIPRHLFSKRVVSKREEETRFNTEPDRRDKEKTEGVETLEHTTGIRQHPAPGARTSRTRSLPCAKSSPRAFRRQPPKPTTGYSKGGGKCCEGSPLPRQADQHYPRRLAVMTPVQGSIRPVRRFAVSR